MVRQIYVFISTDVIQLLLNPVFGHAFVLQKTEVDGAPYFLMSPLLGQTYHRIVCYGILLWWILAERK